MQEHYQAYFCEENAWWLCRDLADRPRDVIFITSTKKACALWWQKLAPPGTFIIWDYHVMVMALGAEGYEVWDPDSRLGCPVDAGVYLRQTFRLPHNPLFRIVDGDAFLAHFSMDHMRDAQGKHKLPPWPLAQAREAPLPLNAYISLSVDGPGEVVDFEQMVQRYCS